MRNLFDTYQLSLDILGSGSRGNAAVVSGPNGAILIDAGFSAKELLRRMNEAHIEPTSISAIVLTHEHSDHISGVGVISRRLGCPVYASAGTLDAHRFPKDLQDVRELSCDGTTTIAGISVNACPISHDAADPIGMRFEYEGDAIGYATDTGMLTQELVEHLCDVRILALESNHDPKMLASGPYPYYLKERVSSHRGHLSNAQAATALATLASNKLEIVIGMHLSQTNNMPMLSTRSLNEALSQLDHSARVLAASQNRPTSPE